MSRELLKTYIKESLQEDDGGDGGGYGDYGYGGGGGGYGSGIGAGSTQGLKNIFIQPFL